MTSLTSCGRMAATLCLSLTVAGGAARAQQAIQAEPAAPGQQSIDIDEFRRLFLGKTAHFVLEDGTAWGREYYAPGSNRSVFVFANGGCFDGHWEQMEDRYCFYYHDQPSCWLTFWEDGQIIVVSGDGMRQRIAEIAESEPLSCEPAVISRATTPGNAG